jgi:hypothetical protein
MAAPISGSCALASRLRRQQAHEAMNRYILCGGASRSVGLKKCNTVFQFFTTRAYLEDIDSS